MAKGYKGLSGTKINESLNYANILSQNGERFNPYDYINQSDYKKNRHGQAQYAEDLAQLQYYADLAQQNWQNSYNEARVADERAYNEKLIASDREYNSYSNQVALMKQAGLNPDLLGVSPGSSTTPTSGTNSSSDGPSGGSNPLDGISTNGQVVGDVVSIIGSVAQTATALYTGGLSAVGMSISNASSLFGMLGDAMSAFDNSQGVSFSQFINSSPISNSQKRRLNRFYESYFGSPRDITNNNDFNTKSLNSNANRMMSLVNPLINPDDIDGDGVVSEKDWSSVWKPIFDAQYKEMKDILSLNSKKRTVESNQLDVTNSDLNYLSNLREPFRQVIDNMFKKYQNGNDFWGYALSALYMILNIKGVSFDSSSSPKGDKSSFKFGIQ